MPEFRRSPYLIGYWQGRRLIFENYATGVSVLADPLAPLILDFFDRWRRPAALFRRMRQFTPASIRRAIADLEGASLLQRRGVTRTPAERAMRRWTAWNPAAGYFHASTKDVPYTSDHARSERYLRQRVNREPVPAPLKHYAGAVQIPLPPAPCQGEFTGVLLERRTWRQFSPRPLAMSALGTLLGLTFGAQRWLDLGAIGRMPLKTSPSGGGRHPIEAYVLAPRIEGLPQGLYHYAPDSHALERLPDAATTPTIAGYLADQWWFADAAALVLMTAVFPRVQWRYRFARAYRAVLVEAGHCCQTFCLVATWLGLAPFCSLAFRDSRIEADLGLDGVSESVLYAAGVGGRPEGTAWTPWPSRRRTSIRNGKSRSASVQ